MFNRTFDWDLLEGPEIPSLNWQCDNGDTIRVFTDDGSIDEVISNKEFLKTMVSGVYKDRPYFIDGAEYTDRW